MTKWTIETTDTAKFKTIINKYLANKKLAIQFHDSTLAIFNVKNSDNEVVYIQLVEA